MHVNQSIQHYLHKDKSSLKSKHNDKCLRTDHCLRRIHTNILYLDVHDTVSESQFPSELSFGFVWFLKSSTHIPYNKNDRSSRTIKYFSNYTITQYED